jgi:exopolyphosphatase/guanosine-5'-triphosphate,3'-diphosphate pyrophosphatase
MFHVLQIACHGAAGALGKTYQIWLFWDHRDRMTKTDMDWGPFSQPLFGPSPTRGLERVGVVDIGSNSVRLVIFDGAARSPAYFYNEKILCALGAGLVDTGRLNPKGRKRALTALSRFQRLAKNLGLPPLAVVATAAVREAQDGADFCAEAKATTGLDIRVIDGVEEARLSAQGVLLGWPGSFGLVCDIGGASMELAAIAGGQVGRCVTSSLGPLKLRDLSGNAAERRVHIRTTVDALAQQMGPQHDRLFLVGGSWRAIARLDILRRSYPLKVLHEYRMTIDDVMATAQMISDSDLDKLRRKAGVSSGRAALVPLASEVLAEVVHRFEPADIAISSYGIREGLLFEHMPQKLRDRDPLLEACRFAEAKDARSPGAGSWMYKFIAPLFDNALPSRQRIVKAACYLHDVSWRAHPDYRAETCFDYATRANLGGLKHAERIFLGLALMQRYSNKHAGSQFETLSGLLDAKDAHQASVLGKAMRLGALLSMETTDPNTAKLSWGPDSKTLCLHVDARVHIPVGEVAEAQLRYLAQDLGGVAQINACGT